MNDYPHDPEQEAADYRQAVLRHQRDVFEQFIIKRERARIIKMLENQHNFDQIFLDAVDQVIALIKGEKNE